MLKIVVSMSQHVILWIRHDLNMFLLVPNMNKHVLNNICPCSLHTTIHKLPVLEFYFAKIELISI